MNRELKFRVWTKNERTGEMYMTENFSLDKEFDCMYGCFNGVVMQYTGEKDFKGKEIYEGDIITYLSDDCIINGKIVSKREYHIEQVIYINGMFCLDDEDDMPFALWSKADGCEFEVIRNIYEDFDLLDKPVALRE